MAGVSLRKDEWRIYWQWPGHKRKFGHLLKSEYSKKQAWAEAYRIEREGPPKESANLPTFKELADRFFLNRDVAEATKAKACKCVQEFDYFLQSKGLASDVNAVTGFVVQDYMASRKDSGYKPASINVDLAFLKLVFKKYHADGVLGKNPTEGIKYQTEERMVKVLPTKDEVVKILRWFHSNELLFYPWVYFEMTRGWRRDELRLMKVEDIDLQGEKLYVKHTKTRVQRIERLGQDDCLVLNEHLIHLKEAGLYQPSGYLFPAKNGGLICKNTLLRKVKQAAKSVGITKNITNHLFRHYVVTSILSKTANVEVVKAITGHKDTKTILEHYAHATPENVEKGLEITRIDTGLKVKSVPKVVPKRKKK